MKKSEAEIEKLKESWKHDPIWDIEDTEGFEEHREELIAFSKMQNANWDANRLLRQQKDKEAMGLGGVHVDNNMLFKYIKTLEFKIERLEDRLEKLNG